jgi:hypothetical protein
LTSRQGSRKALTVVDQRYVVNSREFSKDVQNLWKNMNELNIKERGIWKAEKRRRTWMAIGPLCPCLPPLCLRQAHRSVPSSDMPSRGPEQGEPERKGGFYCPGVICRKKREGAASGAGFL